MNFSKIKNLVKRNGDRIILVENDEPAVVVMSFEEYEKIAGDSVAPASENQTMDSGSLLDQMWESADDPLSDSPGRRAEDTMARDSRMRAPLFSSRVEKTFPEETLQDSVPFSSGMKMPAPAVRLEDIHLEDLPIESSRS